MKKVNILSHKLFVLSVSCVILVIVYNVLYVIKSYTKSQDKITPAKPIMTIEISPTRTQQTQNYIEKSVYQIQVNDKNKKFLFIQPQETGGDAEQTDTDMATALTIDTARRKLKTSVPINTTRYRISYDPGTFKFLVHVRKGYSVIDFATWHKKYFPQLPDEEFYISYE